MLKLESPTTHALYTMIQDKTYSQVIMLTSETIHAFIIEVHQGIKASKDLSRSLRVITWLWRTRKEFMYTVFESRKGNLRRAFFISIQPFLFKPIFPYSHLFFFFSHGGLLQYHCLPLFIFFFSTMFSFSFGTRQTRIFQIFFTIGPPFHHFLISLFIINHSPQLQPCYKQDEMLFTIN